LFNNIILGKKVIINLKTDKAFRGYIVKKYNKLYELKNAELLEPNTEPIQIKGSIIIEKENIDFIQITGE
jgi:small nuclear ribonucleoprotein (snRNP)-like protein